MHCAHTDPLVEKYYLFFSVEKLLLPYTFRRPESVGGLEVVV